MRRPSQAGGKGMRWAGSSIDLGDGWARLAIQASPPRHTYYTRPPTSSCRRVPPPNDGARAPQAHADQCHPIPRTAWRDRLYRCPPNQWANSKPAARCQRLETPVVQREGVTKQLDSHCWLGRDDRDRMAFSSNESTNLSRWAVRQFLLESTYRAIRLQTAKEAAKACPKQSRGKGVNQKQKRMRKLEAAVRTLGRRLRSHSG